MLPYQPAPRPTQNPHPLLHPDVSASVEADAVMATGLEVLAACAVAAIETTRVINAANEVAAEVAVGYTAAQYDVSAGLVWRQMQ